MNFNRFDTWKEQFPSSWQRYFSSLRWEYRLRLIIVQSQKRTLFHLPGRNPAAVKIQKPTAAANRQSWSSKKSKTATFPLRFIFQLRIFKWLSRKIRSPFLFSSHNLSQAGIIKNLPRPNVQSRWTFSTAPFSFRNRISLSASFPCRDEVIIFYLLPKTQSWNRKWFMCFAAFY